jgi:hypothetical protein
MNRRSLATLLAGCALAGACYDLDVAVIQPTGGTTYTREEILASPVLMDRLVAGTFVDLWTAVGDESPWTAFSVYGEELTTSATNIDRPIWQQIREPRVEIANNLGVEHDMMKVPWAWFYAANSSAAEYGGIVEANNIQIIDPALNRNNTLRFKAFSKFIMGLSHVYLGLIFDSAAVVGYGIDLSKPVNLPLKGNKEVLDSGIKYLQDAIDFTLQGNFAFPINEGQWIYRTSFDNSRLRAVAHSYIARAMVYGARTKAERDAVDWAVVKDHLLQGTFSNFGPLGQPSGTTATLEFTHRSALTAAPWDPPANPTDLICNGECTFAGRARVDNRLVGPADTSGAYQLWLQHAATARFDTVAPFFVATPDKRIQPSELAIAGPPVNKPAYFKVTDVYPPQSLMDTTLRGKYFISFYWNSTRGLDNHSSQFPRDGGGRNEEDDLNTIPDEMLLGVEMDLLLAEAHWRLNEQQAAVDLINKTRTSNGELPAITTGGVPDAINCVPRRSDGVCGTVMDALMYEKRLETYGTGIAYFDMRGWGCLIKGTPLHLPPPGAQLDLLGKKIYSYGGSAAGKGAPDPDPQNCRLFHYFP